MGWLGRGLMRFGGKQGGIHDRRMLAREDLILGFDLTDIELVAKHVVQRAVTEWDATARRARREPFCLGPDVAFLEVPYQFIDAAEFQVSPEDQSDQFSLFFDDGDLALLHFIAKGQGASDPRALSLRCRDLVADPIGGDVRRSEAEGPLSGGQGNLVSLIPSLRTSRSHS